MRSTTLVSSGSSTETGSWPFCLSAINFLERFLIAVDELAGVLEEPFAVPSVLSVQEIGDAVGRLLSPQR